ncbi:hypothetical protein [Mycolicibacterium setense]|uniref:hypothetical protein n=1 Tax=Mycolicibacterium setense TaxID=431269 RepID=UPI00068CF225|nr:hypothetical protein [Mycolicibacterium setense]
MSQPALHKLRKRWPFAIAALTTVIAVVVSIMVWWFSAGSEAWARSQWNPPEQVALAPMHSKPVAGWKIDIAALGLPPGSKFTVGDPGLPGPIIETGTSRAYLLGSGPGPTPQWWLTGVDATDGHRLFPPVSLSASTIAPSCFLNGASVVCISDDHYRATAWIIDRQTGALTFTGPTEVRLITRKLKARQAGNYLVAATEKQGLYGVGPQAQTTWFIPGVGMVGSHNDEVAFQGGGREGSATMFALEDGKVLLPEFPSNTDSRGATFFDGGFAEQFTEKPGRDFVQFFDTTGNLTTNKRFEGSLGNVTENLVGIADSDSYGVYTPQGARLLRVSGGRIHLIGTTLWVSETDKVTQSTVYRPYDMRTGDKGEPCEFNVSTGYLGSDGTVAVRAPSNPKSDLLADAWDLAACERVWSIPRNGPFGRLTRLGDTLVRVSDDGTELFSLVSP